MNSFVGVNQAQNLKLRGHPKGRIGSKRLYLKTDSHSFKYLKCLAKKVTEQGWALYKYMYAVLGISDFRALLLTFSMLPVVYKC